MKVVEQIEELEKYTTTSLKNIQSLHQRERQKKHQFLCNWYSEIFLDLMESRGGAIDYNTDSLFLRMVAIRENFYKFMR